LSNIHSARILWILALLSFFAGFAAPANAGYVQSNALQDGTARSSMSVALPAPESAGNVILVAVGWGNSTSTISSLSDSRGNTYALLNGPASIASTARQSVYYAKNISAGTNTVSVTFSGSVPAPSLRVLEYSGLDPVNPIDAIQVTTGNSGAWASGVTTTGAPEILVALGYTQYYLTSPGDGTQDRISGGNGFAEEVGALSTGFNQVYGEVADGWWLIHTVALRWDLTAPSTPTGLTATPASSTQINLSWNASTDAGGVAGYALERCLGSGCSNFAQIAAPTALSYSDVGLTPGALYSYRVRAKDIPANWSAYSTVASATTQASGPGSMTYGYDAAGRLRSAMYGTGVRRSYTLDAAGNRTNAATEVDTAVPGQPGTLTFSSIARTTATATWGASTDNFGVTGYDYRLQGGSWVSLANVLTVNLTGLTSGTAYTFDVRARDAAGLLSALRTGTFTTATDTTPPGTPGALTFSSITASGATATWGAATDDTGVAGYDYRVDGGTWTSLGNVLTVSVTGLTGATAHTFDVRARDAAGNVSATPRSGSFTTLDGTPPGLPGTITFTNITATSFTVNWTAATDNVAVTGYRLRLLDGATQISDTALGNVLTNTITGRTSGKTYTVEVRAYDAANNLGSARSGTVTTLDNIPPSVPAGLAVSYSIGSNGLPRLVLTWNASTDTGGSGLTGYRIYRTDVSGNGQLGTATTTTYTDSSLFINRTYTYNVTAYDGAGNESAHSANVPGTTGIPPVTGVTATAASTTQINVSWSAYNCVQFVTLGYSVYRNGGFVGYVQNTTSFSDTGLTPNTAYSYTVDALCWNPPDDTDVTTPQSSPATATTLADTAAPSAPGGLTATRVSSSQVNLAWTGSTDTGGSGLAGYRIYRNGSLYTTTTATTYSDPTATDYTYTIVAYDNAGNPSSPSNAAAPADAVAPPTPTGLSVSYSIGSNGLPRLVLTWNGVTDIGSSGVAGYRIYRDHLSGAYALLGSSATTSYSDGSLFINTTYTYSVSAYDNAGNESARSANVSGTTGIPPVVGVSAGAVSTTQINVSWSAYNCVQFVTLGYSVYRNGGFVGYVQNTTSFSDTGLTPNTAYSYAVDATCWNPPDDTDVTTPRSSPATATTLADTAAPSAPSGLTATRVSSSQVNLAWAGSTDTGGSGLAGYKIYRNGSLYTTTTATTYSDPTATDYTYTIVAYDNAGNSSSPSNAAAPADHQAPPTPTGLSVSYSVGSNGLPRLVLTWNGVTDIGASGVAGYRIYRDHLSGAYALLGSSATTSYSDGSLFINTTYTYSVSAYDNAGNESARSANVSGTTGIPPVVGVSASAVSTSRVNVSWSAYNCVQFVTLGYSIYRNGAFVGYVQTSTSFSDTGLQPNTTYSYTVDATCWNPPDDTDVSTPQSSPVSATTPP
jgi:fibronectin type 3 domain-containing protein